MIIFKRGLTWKDFFHSKEYDWLEAAESTFENYAALDGTILHEHASIVGVGEAGIVLARGWFRETPALVHQG